MTKTRTTKDKLDLAKAGQQHRTMWAVYLSNVGYGVNGIELHLTYREALDSAAAFYEVTIEGTDDENAYERILEAAGSESWYIQEVEIP